jgi:phenylpropionate dioxygenase-like ring-hydroxylating dioxygenase large terminal subunit
VEGGRGEFSTLAPLNEATAMERSVESVLKMYSPNDPLEKAWTIPAPWYFDERIAQLERQSVFAGTWQVVGRADQVRKKEQFFTADVAGEPLVVARGEDGVLRAFYNVCRHHAAAVVTEVAGSAKQFRCPYHGWTYANDGALKGMVEFEGVCDFDRAKNGLVPVRTETWENFVFVNLDGRAAPLKTFLGKVPELVAPLQLTEKLKFFVRRVYTLNCNWKVYVDNYLDGGYHVPHAHKGLSSVIEYTSYTVENLERASLQSTPLSSNEKSEAGAAATRKGRAFYLWIYPNFMINTCEGLMDTNLVLPLAVNRCAVIFDYYFADTTAAAEAYNRESIRVSEVVQDEDMAICDSVQRGLASRAYVAGRLSVRREAGEHLFHRLLYADLTRGLGRHAAAD